MVTPHEAQQALAKHFGIDSLLFKREDLHPYQSHKGRSIPPMIDLYMKEGKTKFGISSSGNAAIAAALYIEKVNNSSGASLLLTIFVGKYIAPEKLSEIETISARHPKIQIEKVERPRQELLKAEQSGTTSLRQSTDNNALIGYEELAKELSTITDLSDIFIAASSGTTAQALADYFNKNKPGTVSIHAVQTTSCHPIFNNFTGKVTEESEIRSIADAIVDHIGLRKEVVTSLIRESGGSVLIAENSDIQQAIENTKKLTSLDISPNSALSVAGLQQMKTKGWVPKGSVVCIICGK